MKKFKKTYIEITNLCNLSCEFCPKTNRSAGFMSQESFERVLLKIKGHSEYLYFHVMGEPLLHTGIGLFLDLCQKHGYRVNITTNGTLINKAAHLITQKPALRQVNFSLHSFEGHGNTYPLDTYLDNIFLFIREALIKRQLLICLRLWNLSDGVRSEKNGYVLRRIEKEFNIPNKIEQELTPCRGIKLSDNIFLNQASKFDWPGMQHKEMGEKGFCYGLRDQIAILVDGTVVPCCLDGEGTIKLGNILEDDFTEILESKRAKDIYEGFSRREVVETLCRRCGYRQRFNV